MGSNKSLLCLFFKMRVGSMLHVDGNELIKDKKKIIGRE